MTEMTLTQDKLDYLWDKVSHSPSIYSILDGQNKERFSWFLTSSSHVLEYDFGFVRISDIHEGKYALVHGVFWSPRVFRHIDKIRRDAMLIMKMHNLQYLCAVIPSSLRGLRHLVTEIGFQKGPLLSNYYEVPNCPIDGQVYYLSKED